VTILKFDLDSSFRHTDLGDHFRTCEISLGAHVVVRVASEAMLVRHYICDKHESLTIIGG